MLLRTGRLDCGDLTPKPVGAPESEGGLWAVCLLEQGEGLRVGLPHRALFAVSAELHPWGAARLCTILRGAPEEDLRQRDADTATQLAGATGAPPGLCVCACMHPRNIFCLRTPGFL